MKIKVFFSLLLGSALALSAQGYKDGIEYYKADQYQNAKTILERTLNASSTDQAEANIPHPASPAQSIAATRQSIALSEILFVMDLFLSLFIRIYLISISITIV